MNDTTAGRSRRGSLSHVADLFSLAIADGFVSPEELTIIYAKGEALGLRQEDIDEAIRNPDAVQFDPPSSVAQTAVRIYDLAQVVLGDDHVDPKEMDVLRAFARRFGLRDEIVDELIEAVIQEMREGTSREDLEARIVREASK
jgi:uncharacterized tellurite resistance protein B-like protein